MTSLSKDEVVKPDDFKFKHADLLNRLYEMQRSPYYATACHTLIQAEMAIVGLEQDIAPLVAEVERLKADLEQTRVQLACCGVAAMQNTEESKANRVERGAYGWSASYGDVCRMVDREIELRAENARLKDDYQNACKTVAEMAIVGLEQDIAPLVAENAQLRTELATANERHAGLMLAVVDRDMIIKQYAAAMKRGEA